MDKNIQYEFMFDGRRLKLKCRPNVTHVFQMNMACLHSSMYDSAMELSQNLVCWE